MPVAVKGMRELSAAFAKADREQKRGLPIVLRDVAEPVRRSAQGLARQTIPRLGGPWSEMRVGVTRTLVYVAPKQRGVGRRTRDALHRRPNLAPLLMTRGMEPALALHEQGIERGLDAALDRLADDFNRGGGPTV